MNDTVPAAETIAERVECSATKEPAIRVLLMAVMALAFGAYCYYDAYVNQKYIQQASESSMMFNKVCSWVLPPIGLFLLGRVVWMLRRKFVADNEGLGWVGQDKVAWSSVKALVVKGKELFDVHYSADGQDGVLHLDSWKMKNFVPLVKLIESKTPGIKTEVVKQK